MHVFPCLSLLTNLKLIFNYQIAYFSKLEENIYFSVHPLCRLWYVSYLRGQVLVESSTTAVQSLLIILKCLIFCHLKKITLLLFMVLYNSENSDIQIAISRIWLHKSWNYQAAEASRFPCRISRRVLNVGTLCDIFRWGYPTSMTCFCSHSLSHSVIPMNLLVTKYSEPVKTILYWIISANI